MAKSLVKQTLIAYSTAAEAALNSMILVASGMTSTKTRSTGLPLPADEKFDDSGDIGNGINGEFPTEQTSGFMNPPAFEISNVVDVGTFLPLLRRFMGGADPTPAGGSIIEAGIAFQHAFSMLSNSTGAGLQLPSSTFAYSNNGADNLLGGCVANTLQIAQTGGADPTFTMGFVGSGLYKRIRDISGPAFGTLTPPTKQPKMKGQETAVEFTDGGGLFSMTSNRRLVSVTFNANNAIDTGQRLAGASRVDPTDLTKGWYLDELLHGDRTAGATIRVFLDDNMREYLDARANTLITGLKIRFRGYNIPTTAAASAYLLELTFPQCYLRNPRDADEGAFKAVDIDVFATTDNITFGLFTARAINGVATAIV
jgi:hypothetical protein